MLNSERREATSVSAPPGKFGARILDLAEQLAQFSETSDGLTCSYFSPAHKAAAAQLRDWMRAAGLEAEIDAVGNVVGRYASAAAAAKTLIVGSHYDTVANAGRFDGRLGILTALVVAEHLHHTGQRLPFDLQVIGFAEEEGVRFSTPYLGSSAIAGRFDASILQRRDAQGASLAAILENDGVGVAAITALARRPETLRGYLEVHIEQGPVLLQRNLAAWYRHLDRRLGAFSREHSGHRRPCRNGADAASSRRGRCCRGNCSRGRTTLQCCRDVGRYRRSAFCAARLDQRHSGTLRIVARRARRRRRHPGCRHRRCPCGDQNELPSGAA